MNGRHQLVSVVIPIRNEVRALRQCLEAVLSQDYSGEFEVIVVEGASTDGTVALLEEIARSDTRLRWSTNPTGHTPTSLNLAIAQARGDVIVRCDGRAVLPGNYLTRVIELLEKTGAGNVGGRQHAVGETPFQKAVAFAMGSRFGVGGARFHRGGRAGPVDTVYLGAFPRRVLDEVGGFDETMLRNQDYELNIRIRRAGHEIHFAPDLVVSYSPRASPGKLSSQYFNFGRWRRLSARLHPGSLKLRQAAPPLLIVALAASLVLVVAGYSTAGLVVPILYLAVLLLGAVVQTMANKDPAGLLVPVALAIMHISWGIGFLLGPPRGALGE